MDSQTATEADRTRRAIERLQREAAAKERRAEQDRHRRDLLLGYLVYVARRHARISQGELAARTGYSRTSITKWESGERPISLEKLFEIADVCGLELTLGLSSAQGRDAGETIVAAAVEHGEDEWAPIELRLETDKFARDYIAARPWRAGINELFEGQSTTR